MIESMMASTAAGYTKLYHPRGVLVSLPVPADPAAAMAHVHGLLDAGWLMQPPGCEPGEGKDLVGWVCRCISNDSPCILLYPNNEQLTYSFVRVYLNNDEDIHAFEAASGMKLESLPVYIGEGKPQRGKNKQVDAFIVRVKKPFEAVIMEDPRYAEARAKATADKPCTIPKNKFVRWGTQAAGGTQTSVPSNPPAPPHHQPDAVAIALQAWDKKLDPDTVNLEKLNSFLPDVKAIGDKAVRWAVWEKLVAFARSAGCEFDDIAKEFVQAADLPF
jgi:hypothetical protein